MQDETVGLFVLQRLALASGFDCSDPRLVSALAELVVEPMSADARGVAAPARETPEGRRALEVAAGLVAFHLEEAGFKPREAPVG